MIGSRQVLDVLRDIAAEHGDERTPEAAYFWPSGEPCCLVGHVFDRLDIVPSDQRMRFLVARDEWGYPVNCAGLPTVGKVWHLDLTENASLLLTRAMGIADDAEEDWAGAVAAAEDEYASRPPGAAD